MLIKLSYLAIIPNIIYTVICITNESPSTNNTSCYKLQDSLKCPQWKNSLINLTWLNSKINDTKLSNEELFDHYILKQTQLYQLNTSDAQCSLMIEKIQQLILPIICSNFLLQENDQNCYNEFKQVCNYECWNFKNNLDTIIKQNEECLSKANILKDRLNSNFNDLCDHNAYKGERGKCLLLNHQDDNQNQIYIDKYIILGGSLALGLSVSIVLFIIILRLRKRRHKLKLIPKTLEPMKENKVEENENKALVYSTFFARRSDEMHLNCGDYITVWRYFDDDWCLGQNQHTLQHGVFPKACLNKPTKGNTQQLIIPPRVSSLAFNAQFTLPSQKSKHESYLPNYDSSSGINISHTRSYSYNNSIRLHDSYQSSIKQAKISSNFRKISLNLKDSNSRNIIHLPYQINNDSNVSINTPPPPVHSPPKPPEEES